MQTMHHPFFVCLTTARSIACMNPVAKVSNPAPKSFEPQAETHFQEVDLKKRRATNSPPDRDRLSTGNAQTTALPIEVW